MGRPDFKSGEGCTTALGGFDSCLLRHSLSVDHFCGTGSWPGGAELSRPRCHTRKRLVPRSSSRSDRTRASDAKLPPSIDHRNSQGCRLHVHAAYSTPLAHGFGGATGQPRVPEALRLHIRDRNDPLGDLSTNPIVLDKRTALSGANVCRSIISRTTAGFSLDLSARSQRAAAPSRGRTAKSPKMSPEPPRARRIGAAPKDGAAMMHVARWRTAISLRSIAR